MQNSETYSIIDRYLSGTATTEEALIVEKWLDEETDLNNEWNIMDNEQRKQVLQDLYSSIMTDLEVKKGKVIWLKRHWGWAAAGVVILFTTGLMLINHYRTDKPVVANIQPVHHDVLPGKEGAILTLSNGKQIVLDSAGNGELVNEKGALVNKDGNSITYKTKNEKAVVTYNTMITPKGRQYQLQLADGTRVWLNAASSIRFPTAFTGSERKVEITGEVYFEVTHQHLSPAETKVQGSNRIPFIVSVNGTDIVVLGTHFNVNAYNEEGTIKTTLLQGKVKIKRNGTEAVLKPGEQAIAPFDISQKTSPGNKPQVTITKPNLDEVMSWKNGYFYFESADLKTILKQFARWYDISVVYENDPGNDRYFAIISRNTSLVNVLKSLQANQVKFRIEGKTLYVMGG